MISKPQVFLFLSQILGKRVVDPEGRPGGRVSDLVAKFGETYPLVTGLVLSRRGRKTLIFLPWPKVVEIGREVVAYLPPPDEPTELVLEEGERLLKDSLLDKQIVDTHGAKVLRVNDLHLLWVKQSLRLVHVDVGLRGLMRRVGLERVMDKLLQWLFDYHLSDHFIPWRFVQPLSSPDLLRLKVAQNRLAQLHPADLADIIEELDIHKGSEVFQALDVETAAEALEEADPKVQVRLIESVNPALASDILEEMSPSEAADLLGDLPKEKAEGLLREMEQEIAEDVKELLVHPEEKAGGLMTTSFPALPPQTTAQEALEYLRREAENLDLIYYLYVTGPDDRLLGVVNLRELLTNDPKVRLADIMSSRVISVDLEGEKEEITDRFAKYGFKAIPVVDERQRIKGVIPFRNLLEAVAPNLGK
ncbi:MAG: magnesium transporter [Deltaproteobacteria bacterium]|nr:magnesium transporter [Deltaproteobacteria bacterium]